MGGGGEGGEGICLTSLVRLLTQQAAYSTAASSYSIILVGSRHSTALTDAAPSAGVLFIFHL